MKDNTLTISYPDDLPESMGKTKTEFAAEVQFLVAAKLYEIGKISSGRAARMAEMDRKSFLLKLKEYKIPAPNYSLDELEQEIREARERALS